jgi:hypothetical protein
MSAPYCSWEGFCIRLTYYLEINIASNHQLVNTSQHQYCKLVKSVVSLASMKLMVYSYKEGSNMPNKQTTQPKKKIFVNVPLKDEEEQTAIRTVAAKKNKSMAEYIRDLVRADMAQQPQHAGAGQ